MRVASDTSIGKNFQSKRFYKVKKPRSSFLCALCSAPRQMKYSKNLSLKNYFQLTLLAVSLSWLCFPLMGFKSLFWVWIIWPAAEMVNKLLYRKEIPCPYCGFDATWYRRDVRIARKKVEEFWAKNHPELVQKGKEMANAVSHGEPEVQVSESANNSVSEENSA